MLPKRFGLVSISFQEATPISWLVKSQQCPAKLRAYFTEKELREFLLKCNKQFKKTYFAIIEPINIDISIVKNSEPRGNIAYSHNYPLLFKECKYINKFLKLIPIDKNSQFYDNIFLIEQSH